MGFNSVFKGLMYLGNEEITAFLRHEA